MYVIAKLPWGYLEESGGLEFTHHRPVPCLVQMRANPYPVLPSAGGSTNEIYANTDAHRSSQAMSMFRASPWVTYDPPVNNHLDPQEMDEDIDMDAPQISILREEVTPPPLPKSASTSRRSKVSAKPRTADFPTWSRPVRKEPQTEEEFEEAEEEEDQLIDDDDDDDMKPVPPAALSASRSSDSTSKRKSPAKKKPRKNDKRVADDGKNAGEKTVPTHSEAPPLTWLASEHHEDAHPEQIASSISAEVVPPKVVSPKKAPVQTTIAPTPQPKAPKVKVLKAPTTSKAKAKPTKLKLTLPLLVDDPDFHSEGYAGTAASSPVTVHIDIKTPESEAPALALPAPLTEETNLENGPIPVYPLPTKPFPVQPPPKIHSGFAPVMPLDKSGKKVRHWRVANREIRGIGGGRWFARSWVGEKESELAAAGGVSAQAKAGESGLTLPKLISISASASGRSSKSKASKATSSLAASAAPSRAGSSIPDVPTSTVRAPTKMRTIIAPPMSEGGDSDMAAT